jgi:DNA-binding PadR family transcriptional regulator
MTMRIADLAAQLTDQDRALLAFVGGAGIASLDQLYRRHWPGRSLPTCCDRLGWLQRAGLLEGYYTNARRPGDRVYALTPAGRAVLPPGERARTRVGRCPRAEHKQQLLAQEYRLRLEAQLARQGARLVDWWDERELRREYARAGSQPQRAPGFHEVRGCADARAVIAYEDGGRATWDIEIDGAYYGAQLARKMQALAAGQRAVIYLCEGSRAPIVRGAAAAYSTIQVVTL